MFVVVNDQKISRGDFIAACRKAGSFICTITKPSDVVLISKRTSLDQIAAFVGCIMYNRIPTLAPHPSQKVFEDEFLAKLEKINSAANPSICICDSEDEHRYSKVWKCITSIGEAEELPIPKQRPNDTALIQLSSGTTALPKVVSITHKALVAQCEEYAHHIGLGKKCVIVSWLPLYHDMGMIACFMMPLILGAGFVHINPFTWLSNPEILLSQINKYGGTHVWMPNFAFAYMTKRCSVQNLPTVRQWISCSEVTRPKDITEFARKFHVPMKKMHTCYALAENVFAASHGPFKVTNGIVSCGEIVPGTSVALYDTQKQRVIMEDGVEGKVLLKSSYMASGLPNYKWGYYDTGDRGSFKDNELYISGRTDDMIISHGENIYPYAIEARVSEIDGVIPGRVACFGVPQKGTEEMFVVAECSKPNLESKISQTILDKFGIMARCKTVSRGYIIKTSSGKISRKRTQQKVLGERKK